MGDKPDQVAKEASNGGISPEYLAEILDANDKEKAEVEAKRTQALMKALKEEREELEVKKQEKK